MMVGPLMLGIGMKGRKNCFFAKTRKKSDHKGGFMCTWIYLWHTQHVHESSVHPFVYIHILYIYIYYIIYILYIYIYCIYIYCIYIYICMYVCDHINLRIITYIS